YCRMSRSPSPRNRTLRLSPEEIARLTPQLRTLTSPVCDPEALRDTIIHQDLFETLPHLPRPEGGFIDLLIADPPYNLAKAFNGRRFRALSPTAYMEWLASWLLPLKPLLKPTASLYLCGDWHSSGSIYPLLS